MARPVPHGRASGAFKRRKRARPGRGRLSQATVALILQLRRSLRMTGAAIAAKPGLSRSTVSRWQRRECLRRLAQFDPPHLFAATSPSGQTN